MVKEYALTKLLDKLKYVIMLSYCSKCKKIQKTKIQGFQRLVMVKQCYYENILYAAVKSKDF